MYIYLYIIYNIKKKKKEPTHRVAPLGKKKPMHGKGCGLRLGRNSAQQCAADWILGATATCNLQFGLRFPFR